jgi:hypothetical protein
MSVGKLCISRKAALLAIALIWHAVSPVTQLTGLLGFLIFGKKFPSLII